MIYVTSRSSPDTHLGEFCCYSYARIHEKTCILQELNIATIISKLYYRIYSLVSKNEWTIEMFLYLQYGIQYFLFSETMVMSVCQIMFINILWFSFSVLQKVMDRCQTRTVRQRLQKYSTMLHVKTELLTGKMIWSLFC